jgi:hypothetical protein
MLCIRHLWFCRRGLFLSLWYLDLCFVVLGHGSQTFIIRFVDTHFGRIRDPVLARSGTGRECANTFRGFEWTAALAYSRPCSSQRS